MIPILRNILLQFKGQLGERRFPRNICKYELPGSTKNSKDHQKPFSEAIGSIEGKFNSSLNDNKAKGHFQHFKSQHESRMVFRAVHFGTSTGSEKTHLVILVIVVR